MGQRDSVTDRPTLVILSQVYVPDPASVGQHVADVAAAMAQRGWRVVVFTADRGYENPSVRYPRRELRAGVEVVRLPWSSFGKRSFITRVLGGMVFLSQAVIRASFLRRIDHVLTSTSPPMCGVGGVVLKRLRRASTTYWVMDVNPDQTVALGLANERALSVKLLNTLNRIVLSDTDTVVVLDRFMAERVRRKGGLRGRLFVIPPWAHEEHLSAIPHSENSFRKTHELEGKFVVMYSGNHSPSNPLTTLLRAAQVLSEHSTLRFLFVGGGAGKRDVEALQCPNIASLPYQPLDHLSQSLSAADVHAVTLGDAMVGIIHPCKVYGAMAVARPILYVGPAASHVGELLAEHDVGWQVAHGDVECLVQLLRRLASTAPTVLRRTGQRARRVLDGHLSKDRLCGRFCDLLENRPTVGIDDTVSAGHEVM